MAYDRKNLSVLAYANGFTLWHYRTDDTREETNAVGYFNAAGEMVREGDMIMANVNDAGVPQDGRIFLVTSICDSSVDVKDLTK